MSKLHLIVTGWRGLTDFNRLRGEFFDLVNPYTNNSRHNLTVHVGDCKTGADEMVRVLCVMYTIPCQVYEADWARWGNPAGPIRNTDMIVAAKAKAKLEADHLLCLAFWNGSVRRSGTHDCLTQAVAHGIKTVIVPVGEAWHG